MGGIWTSPGCKAQYWIGGKGGGYLDSHLIVEQDLRVYMRYWQFRSWEMQSIVG